MKFIESFSKDLGTENIYLYTPNKQEMYEKFGWTVKEESKYLSRRVTVMEKELTMVRKLTWLGNNKEMNCFGI